MEREVKNKAASIRARLMNLLFIEEKPQSQITH